MVEHPFFVAAATSSCCLLSSLFVSDTITKMMTTNPRTMRQVADGAVALPPLVGLHLGDPTGVPVLALAFALGRHLGTAGESTDAVSEADIGKDRQGPSVPWPVVSLLVQKFGGTSVADADRIRAVAEHVVRTRRAGNDVVVVVSAMGKTTDDLERLAHEVSQRPERPRDGHAPHVGRAHLDRAALHGHHRPG